MKCKSLQTIMQELKDSLMDESEFINYITGDDFEAWLKEVKNSPKDFSKLESMEVFNDLSDFCKNDVKVKVNCIVKSIEDCGYLAGKDMPSRGTRHKIIFIYEPATHRHVYNIWINVLSEDKVYVDGIYDFRNQEYLFKSHRMDTI